jgi:hypothetical protein
MALANHQGPANIKAGGLNIPVKVGNIDHETDMWGNDSCKFECIIVNPDEITKTGTSTVEKIAKQALNSFYGANGPDYVRQALAKAAAVQTLHEERVKASKPVYVANNPFEIEKVYFNNPVTVVLWADGTKTIVRCQEGDTYSKETGLALCFAKKALGNKSNFNDVFHKWIPEEKNEPVDVTKEISDVIDEIRAVEAEDADNG